MAIISESIKKQGLHHRADLLTAPVFMELKVLFVILSHVSTFRHLLKVLLEEQKFVVLPAVVGQDWNAVLKLEDVGVGSIINEKHAAEISVDDP